MLMVIAQKVQGSVNEKLIKAVLRADTGTFRFPLRGVG